MKILEVSNLGFLNGGVETGIVLLKSEFERQGHEVRIFTSNARPDLPHFSDIEFEALEHQPRILQFLYRAFYPEPFFLLKKFLKSYNPDVVHIHTISQISSSILFLLKRYKTIVTVNQVEDYTTSIITWSFPEGFFTDKSHNRESLTFLGKVHYLYHRYINKYFYRMGFRNVDFFIAISKYMQNCLAQDKIASVHIPNATRLFNFYPIDPKGNNILFVGRLEQSKGVQTLLAALCVIKIKFPYTQLYIAGRGPYQTELEHMTKNMDLVEHVHFLGFQDRIQLYELYKAATVVVMPSIWPEAFGNVGIEAMSVGRPVIASEVGGVSDWLTDNFTGYLVPPENPEAISEKVIELFSNSAVLEQFSLQARKNALEFTIENHVSKLLNLIEQK